jgi:hypothetical protein
MSKVGPGDYLIAADPKNPRRKVLCKYLSSETNPISMSFPFKCVNGFLNRVDLEPIVESTGETLKAVVSEDFTCFKLFAPTPSELQHFLSLPKKGLPLGTMLAGSTTVPLYFPVDPADALYRSAFITGVKGKGKTTAVRNLAVIASSYAGLPLERRPCVVILDGEREFTRERIEKAVLSLRTDMAVPEELATPDVQRLVVLVIDDDPNAIYLLQENLVGCLPFGFRKRQCRSGNPLHNRFRSRQVPLGIRQRKPERILNVIQLYAVSPLGRLRSAACRLCFCGRGNIVHGCRHLKVARAKETHHFLPFDFLAAQDKGVVAKFFLHFLQRLFHARGPIGFYFHIS